MTPTDEPTPDEWLLLYAAAGRFKELAPWEWMSDSDVFAVEDPESEEIGYASIFGAGGELFGLALFLGERGWASYQRQVEALRRAHLTPQEAIELTPYGLFATFEDRAALTSRDRHVIAGLGLRYRGSKAWPLFRFHEPGYEPWYLSDEQARFLTVALEQAAEVAKGVERDPAFLTPPEPGLILLRRRGLHGWQNEWHRPTKPRPQPFPSLDIAEVLRATGVTLARPEGAWDADLFWAPMLVGRRGRERAYFPRMALWADGPSGALLGFHVADPAKFALEAPLRLLESIARHGRPPATLRVRSDEARRLFEPLAAATGMRIVRARRLPALQAIEAEMAERLLVSTSPE